MTIVYSSLNNNYVIDMDSSIKATYNNSVEIKINSAIVASGAVSLLPFTWTPTNGVYEIIIKLISSSGGTYTEKKCFMADQTLLCKVAKEANENKETSAPFLWFLLKEGLNESCTCSCKQLQSVYTDLNNELNETCCCN